MREDRRRRYDDGFRREALELIKSGLDSRNFYAVNPEFDPSPKS